MSDPTRKASASESDPEQPEAQGSPGQKRPSAAPGPFDEDHRTPLERILPELLKRGIEAGRGVSGSIRSRDVAGAIASQLVDVRAGIVTAVAHEVGRFLRSADVASEIRKVLVGLNIEANVQLRFSEREDGTLKTQVDIDADADRGSRRPAARRSEPPVPSSPPPSSED